jgi:hypothetical protein
MDNEEHDDQASGFRCHQFEMCCWLAGRFQAGSSIQYLLLHAVVSKELTASIGVSKIWSAGAMLGSHRPGCWISLSVS